MTLQLASVDTAYSAGHGDVVVSGASSLPFYDAACRAITMAKTVDEAKNIADRSEAARVYARQAKNRTLEVDAAEIRIRAERRLGEIFNDLRKSDCVRVTAPQKDWKRKQGAVYLSELGMTESAAKTCERLGSTEPEVFANGMKDWRDRMEGCDRVTLPLGHIRTPTNYALASIDKARKRKIVDSADKFDAIKMLDGRCIGDVLFASIPSQIRRAKLELELLQSVLDHVAEVPFGKLVRDVVSVNRLIDVTRKSGPQSDLECSLLKWICDHATEVPQGQRVRHVVTIDKLFDVIKKSDPTAWRLLKPKIKEQGVLP